MADLTAQQFEQVPEFLKGDFEQVGDVYRSKAEGKVLSLKASLDTLDGKFKTTDAQLKEILAKSEEDRTKAEQAAFERLKAEGKTDQIVEDMTKRHGETIKQYEERMAKLINNAKSDKRSAIVAALSAELATDAGKKTFSKLIESRIDYDPETGKTIFLNDDGSASSLDYEGFKADLQKSDLYAPVLKAGVNSGGYSQGNNGGGGASKKPEEYNDAERVALFRSDPAKFHQLFPTS